MRYLLLIVSGLRFPSRQTSLVVGCGLDHWIRTDTEGSGLMVRVVKHTAWRGFLRQGNGQKR
jgi:hypothetical protein